MQFNEITRLESYSRRALVEFVVFDVEFAISGSQHSMRIFADNWDSWPLGTLIAGKFIYAITRPVNFSIFLVPSLRLQGRYVLTSPSR